jgi:hypothetical protein
MTTLAQVKIRLSARGWVNSLAIPHVKVLALDPAVEVQYRSFLSDWKSYKPDQPHKARTIYRAKLKETP